VGKVINDLGATESTVLIEEESG